MTEVVKYSGTLSAKGEAVLKNGDRLTRIWRPILSVARENPAPGERREQNVSLSLGPWFLGEPVPEHEIQVEGVWHWANPGRYLDVAVYTDKTTGATFRKDAGELTDVDVVG